MDDKSSSNSNPWAELSTVTTFDRGHSARTTLQLDNNTGSQSNGQVVLPISHPTSLFIESLINQLCMTHERSKERRNKLFIVICDKLHDLKLMDDSYRLRELDPLRSQYQNAFLRLFAVARAITGSDGPPPSIPRCLMTEGSRYQREFQEINHIASGGFGNVYKALHRLDGIEYAVKKIRVRSGRLKNIIQHLEEVKTLAKLNHTNIVSYKCAWIEPTLPLKLVTNFPLPFYTDRAQNFISNARQTFDSQSQLYSDNSQSENNFTDNHGESVVELSNDQSKHELGEHEHTDSEDNIIVEEVNSDSVSFRNSKSSNNCNTRSESNANFIENSDSNEDSDSNKQICSYLSEVDQAYATLYIQMALCEQTLQQWLENRIEPTPAAEITKILTQILCGLDYIHSRKIVHHDIKPSNIFITITGEPQVQLGDFGLACPLQRESHHSVMGTHMYAAPEQLEGKCDPKSDVYSVGIVLLELLVPTNTYMERHEIIKNLKKGHLPATLAIDYPKLAPLVSRLVQPDPQKRPSTSQVLQEINDDKDVLIAKLQSSLIERDNKIQMLQERIFQLEAQRVEYSREEYRSDSL